MHLKGVLTNETALLVEPLQEDLIKSSAVPGGGGGGLLSNRFMWFLVYPCILIKLQLNIMWALNPESS